MKKRLQSIHRELNKPKRTKEQQAEKNDRAAQKAEHIFSLFAKWFQGKK